MATDDAMAEERAPVETNAPVPIPTFAPADVHSAITQFLAYEASLLDQDRMEEWLDLLEDDFVYAVPIREDRERKQGGNQFVRGNYRMHDSKPALRYRIERLLTGHAWVEELASRTSRLVGSVAVWSTEDPAVYHATSSIVVYRQRGDQRDFEIIPARHEDLLRQGADGTFRLVRRTTLLTEKCIATNNLAIIV